LCARLHCSTGKVVKEILEKGGKAVANYDNVLHGEKIVESAMKSFGRCDIVINNAGILRDKSMAKMTRDDWRAVLDVHLEGTFNICHAVWPIMQAQKYGRIINIGSGAGLYGNFGQANYSSAKMAVLGLTNTLALEGVRQSSHTRRYLATTHRPFFLHI
jgi:NAD(P)-dependent dehydrogenase (short-subunit alcohol dehydrogenase family)